MGEFPRNWIQHIQPPGRSDPYHALRILVDSPHGIIAQTVWIIFIVQVVDEFPVHRVISIKTPIGTNPDHSLTSLSQRRYVAITQSIRIFGVCAEHLEGIPIKSV